MAETLKWIIFTLIFGILTIDAIHNARQRNYASSKLGIISNWVVVLIALVPCILCAVEVVASISSQLN